MPSRAALQLRTVDSALYSLLIVMLSQDLLALLRTPEYSSVLSTLQAQSRYHGLVSLVLHLLTS